VLVRWGGRVYLGRESARAAGIARVRYREGATDFLELLDAERTELQAQDAVARVESEVLTSVVSVYKALGGVPGPVDSK
jgi:outer membrane protein TolC